MKIAEDKKVADITLGELKALIREVILETIDPDYGLELRQVLNLEKDNNAQKA